MQERFSDNPQVVKMFLEEARLGAELNHPHIVDVFEIGESDGLRFIAMEYLEGRTLNDVVTRGLEVARPLPRTYAAYVVAQVAEALAYLQAGLPGRGRQTPVVHRDISPPNVIVGYAGGTKLIDFGIARRADARPDEEAGLRPGKVSYMSPEQVRGEPLDGRSDIFSLGTILYEITLGRRLWRGPAAAGDAPDRRGDAAAPELRGPELPGGARAHRHAGAGEAARRSLPGRHRDDAGPGSFPRAGGAGHQPASGHAPAGAVGGGRGRQRRRRSPGARVR